MQPQQQQQGPPYPYQPDKQPQMPQAAYNPAQQPPMQQAAYSQGQGQQPPMQQAAYSQGQGQQPPMQQAAYNQGQGQQPPIPQSAYNQAQPPQVPHGAYNQSQQPQGMRIPQNQVQHPQQSMSFHHPAQAPQLPQVSQSQGLQMPPQQGQLQHGLQFPQHGKLPLSHGQQSPSLKDDGAGGHEGKRTGFSLPLSQQRGQAPISNQQLPSSHQHPGAVNQPNVPGVGGPLYPAKHLHSGSSPAETNNMGFMNSPAQMHQGGVDANYRQQPVSSHGVPNHVGPSPVRPPMGFEMGISDGHFERDDPHSYGRFDGPNALQQQQQQPKLAAIPPSQNPMVMIFDSAT
jgi:ATP-dependent RNA helicase DDX5/DBP2